LLEIAMNALQYFDDARALLESRGFSRRDFVRSTVGTGFAAAALPISAQTAIKTSAEGLLAGEVTIPVGEFKMPAYRAAPAGKSGLPVVLVISEIFGVHEHIADVARRLARQGYCAIAPELFVRQGDAHAFTDIPELITQVVSKVPDGQVLPDLDACVAWAASQGMDTTKLGVTGFCWGGRQTWLYAAHNPSVKAAVAWYGRLVGPTNPQYPRNPLDIVGSLKGPVLGLYGEKDTGITQDSIAQMKTALAEGSPAARQSSFVVYPGAPHAFHADYRASYVKDAAEDGWKRCLEWFKSHGVA
jgi:carboxymethylenebutenolidase